MDLMSAVARVSARRMFGGIGYYADGSFFAIAHGDVLYFRVDERSRADYEREGMAAFSPAGSDFTSMKYFALPPWLFDDQDALGIWMRRAIQVARRTPARKGRT